MIIYIIFEKMEKMSPNETSQITINAKSKSTAKVQLGPKQWLQAFASLQKQQKKQRMDQKNILKNLNVNVIECKLCQIKKNKSQFEYMCKCRHSYCYSCLNSYAITHIEDMSMAKCPQPYCKQMLSLTSNIYRYLPDSVKLKYLQNKHAFEFRKQDEQNRCQRCFKTKHVGQCKYVLAPELIQQSFKYRKCPACHLQIQLTQGRKRVKCLSCLKQICYLCGVVYEDGHKCKNQSQVKQLQQKNGILQQHCLCCKHFCMRNCYGCYQYKDCRQFCCSLVCACGDQCGFGCCIWNVFSVPVRAILSLFVLIGILILFSILCVVVMIWLILCFAIGAPIYACREICIQTNCCQRLIMIVFYPLAIVYYFAVIVSQTYRTPLGFIEQLCNDGCSLLQAIWIKLSPLACNY